MQPKESASRHLVCTIVAPNYLNQFLALSTSLATAMPSVDVRVLVLQDCADVVSFQEAIDENLRRLRSGARHRAVTIDECAWGDFDVVSAALFYNVLEFATAVKPAMLRSFLHDGWERVTYLDPDVQVFEDFTALLDDTTDMALTPHFLTPIPRDGFRPSTNDVLLAGFFNLGFCSVRPGALPFLDWWSERVQFDCLEDHLAGYFTDQKFVDLAPLSVKVQTIKEPGCNVAYWNLHERRVEKDARGWRVLFADTATPLYFFHFSGFLLKGTPSLSKHADRKVLGDVVPRSFANQYERLLRRLTDPELELPFTLGGATLGDPLPREWKRRLRDDVLVHVGAGHSLRAVREEIYVPEDANPWSTCRTCGAEHANFGSRTRRLMAGWALHPSLVGVPNAISAFSRRARHEFTDTAMEQLSWAPDHLHERIKDNDELLAAILATAGAAVRTTVNLKLIGYFSYPAGIGQIARWTLKTLEAAGIHPAIERVFAVTDSNEYLSQLLRRRNPVAASNSSVLCFINADQWDAHVMIPQRINPKTERVEAVWAWELEQIPEEMLAITSSGVIDRVHALSNWGADAMGKVFPIPVSRFSPFNMELLEDLDRSTDQGAVAPNARYVLATFDAKSFLSRKNPEGVVRLWNRVCEDFPEHSLVLKSTDLRDLATPELLDLIDSSTRTTLIDEHLTDHQYFDLLANCEAFVSLHRSEGMGLTPIEAGLCGLPVVYTNYGGVTDFLEGGFFPVSYTLALVGDSHKGPGPYSESAWWAEPDLDDAERQLRSALAITSDSEESSSLVIDRKRLRENLIAAHAEVVITAERLLLHVQDIDRKEYELLAKRLEEPIVAEVEAPLPSPNPVLYALVAVVYAAYKLLPGRVRRHVNLAMIKLRGDSVPILASEEPDATSSRSG